MWISISVILIYGSKKSYNCYFLGSQQQIDNVNVCFSIILNSPITYENTSVLCQSECAFNINDSTGKMGVFKISKLMKILTEIGEN